MSAFESVIIITLRLYIAGGYNTIKFTDCNSFSEKNFARLLIVVSGVILNAVMINHVTKLNLKGDDDL